MFTRAAPVGILLTIILSVVLAACAPAAASPSPSAPGSPAPTGSPTPTSPAPSLPSGTPAPSPSSPAVVIPVDSIAVVVTDDLRVRSKPEISDSSKLLTPLLQKGRQVFVVDGPVAANGYQWYLVSPITEHIEDAPPFGWVAAADNDTGEPWLSPSPTACPALPSSYAEWLAVPALVALACFGDDEIAFAAKVMRPEATCGVDPGWSIEPSWLGAICPQPAFIMIDPDGSAADAYAVTEPGFEAPGVDPGVEPADAVDVVITGAYDHPDAESCELEVTGEGASPEMTPEQVVLHCRTQFVVRAIEPA